MNWVHRAIRAVIASVGMLFVVASYTIKDSATIGAFLGTSAIWLAWFGFRDDLQIAEMEARVARLEAILREAP